MENFKSVVVEGSRESPHWQRENVPAYSCHFDAVVAPTTCHRHFIERTHQASLFIALGSAA